EWVDRLNQARQKLDARRDELLLELKAMNPAWESISAKASRAELPLARLDEIYRLLGYLSRWSQQLQERIVQLSFD
ncbi:MAG: Co-chaperone Hsc20, partial [Pedosphaera sp.]|nr:Co-chaperone Hsc20 [Pedosphaera sp.]